MEEINLKELFNYFLSKLYIIAIITVIVCVLGNIYLFCFQKPLYKSTTKLVLVSESNNNTGITQSDVLLNTNLISTYSEIVKSRNVLSKVINNLDLDYSYEELSNNITVSSITNTQLIKVDVSDEDNELAKEIANEIAIVFPKEVKRIYKIQNIKVVDKAILAKIPYNINAVKQNILYLGVGIVLGLGIVFIMFYFDTSIKDVKTVEEKLGLTVLGVVPKVGDSNEKRK